MPPFGIVQLEQGEPENAGIGRLRNPEAIEGAVTKIVALRAVAVAPVGNALLKEQRRSGRLLRCRRFPTGKRNNDVEVAG